MVIFSNTIGLLILLVLLVVLGVGGFAFLRQKNVNESNGIKVQLEKWYYYLPGTILNVILGLVGRFVAVILVLAFGWRSDRLWAILWAGVYLIFLVGGNIGIYLFLRKKEKFSKKMYWFINMIAYFILSTIIF